MNLRSKIKWHSDEALRLSRAGKDKAARTHALRANQLKTALQIKRETKEERRAS